jgi:hypothetical protein
LKNAKPQSKAAKKSAEKEAAALKKQMRPSTREYQFGINKEPEDNSNEFLELSGSKSKKTDKEKVDEDEAFLMYCKFLYTKKERTDADKRLIDELHAKIVEESYRKLDDEHKRPFVSMWEDDIVKREYDHWRTHGQSSNYKWWAKITPNLHITVILDKLEKQQDLSESDISALAGITNV